jgi:hypothetical protein
MAFLPDKKSGMTGQLMGLTIGKVDILMPFGKEIFLINTHVAGTGHYDVSLALDKLKQEKTLVLRRQPTNPHDELAIEIFTSSGEKLGYVPRKDNPVVARLMDAGKIISATLSYCDNEANGEWVEMNVDISLKDI